MKPRPSKKISRVGLDIGTRCIKIVEISSEASREKLVKFDSAEIEFPPTQTKAGKTLKALLERFRPSTKDINISLSAPSAIVRFIEMPKMKAEDLKNSLRFEAEKYIPFNINDVNIDALILESATGGKSQMRVLLAAAKKQDINSRIDMLKEIGFFVPVIDIDSFACFNAFCNSFESLDESKSTALLNIGYTQTNVVISRGDKPFFTRDILIGGKDVGKAISKILQVDEKESDTLIFDPKDKILQVFEATKPVLSDLANELRLSFGYYENQYGKGLNEIYVSGGVTRLEGILNYFEESFGMKPILWNPFSRIEIGPDVDPKSLQTIQSQFAVSCGLAIRK
ncbi:MAG: type IV pilus assembly protein PilM [Candidatus Omnitrophica bacterium]|nr:type IV pilus assembly protein PilM [Candidatus Omnitrophota bacterium]